MSTAEINTYNNVAKAKSVFDLLKDGQIADLLTLITDFDTAVFNTLNQMPETRPEGVRTEFYFGYWDDNEDRQDSNCYRMQNGCFEVSTAQLLPKDAKAFGIIDIFEEVNRMDLLTMLQILAHDRETRPELYPTTL